MTCVFIRFGSHTEGVSMNRIGNKNLSTIDDVAVTVFRTAVVLNTGHIRTPPTARKQQWRTHLLTANQGSQIFVFLLLASPCGRYASSTYRCVPEHSSADRAHDSGTVLHKRPMRHPDITVTAHHIPRAAECLRKPSSPIRRYSDLGNKRFFFPLIDIRFYLFVNKACGLVREKSRVPQ